MRSTQILHPLNDNTSQTVMRNKKDLWKYIETKLNDLKEGKNITFNQVLEKLGVTEQEYTLAIQSLLSCPTSNNANCLNRKMLLRNAITASKNANCLTFETSSTSIIPFFFHSTKHKAPLSEAATTDDELQITLEEKFLCTQLIASETSEFVSNILFYIGGYLVSKLVNKLTCLSCKNCLVSQFHGPTPDHGYCATKYNEISSAAAFTLFVNNGGLRIAFQSVCHVVEYSEKMNERKNWSCLFVNTSHWTATIKFSTATLQMLIKATAERYFTLLLFSYSKRYYNNVIAGGKQGTYEATYEVHLV